MTLSKRTCGFLTTSVAKRLKLPTALERKINSYLMKPRDYYAYMHGTPHRHKAYTLCLAAIHNAGSGGSDSSEGVFWLLAFEIADDLLLWERYGMHLPTDHKVISGKEMVRAQLGDVFCDYFWNNREGKSILYWVRHNNFIRD